jgi:hypothetical protein
MPGRFIGWRLLLHGGFFHKGPSRQHIQEKQI